MICTVIIPKTEKVNLTITVPENYIGREMEVIAFTKDEGVVKKNGGKKVAFAVLNVNRNDFKFNRDEANER